jgi:hypothetical protein
LKIVKALTGAGNVNNEDLMKYNNKFCLLLDGSTGLKKNLIKEYKSDAIWYVNIIAKFLEENINDKIDLKELTKDAIKNAYNKFNNMNLKVDNKIDYPSASYVLIRDREEFIDLLSIGDCTIIIENKLGNISIIHDESVSKLDNSVVKRMEKLSSELGIDISETREMVKNDLISNRNKKNTEEGYWILEFDEKAVDNSKIINMKKEDLSKICLFTDGFADYYETLKIEKDYEKFYNLVLENDLEDLYKKLRITG